MMAVRGRAVAVMAALDRRVPSLDDFVGQNWSSWAERTTGFVSDAGADAEECSKNGKNKVETMTLRKEDMSTFGHCPAHDDFYLVVCSHCGQVVKPQAFEKHCERRHGPLGKLCGHLHSSPSASLRRPCPSVHGASNAAWDGRHQGVGPRRALPQPPLTPPQYRHGKPQKEAAGFSPSDKVSQAAPPGACHFKQAPPSDSPSESSPGPRDPPWPHGATQPSTTPPPEKPLTRRGEPSHSPNLAPIRGPRTYKKASRKECDLDKHCGVLDPERKKLCTRLLTCNIHSVHQRRKVLGRSKNFNQLVAELKTGSKARERPVQSREGPEACSPCPEPSGDQTGEPNCSAAFRSRTSSESTPEEDRARTEEREAPPPSPPAHRRLSSEESDGEGQEEPPDWHSTPWHPRPLALCSFGSHALGRSVFTFDRRLHHLRSALSTMVENHLNAHLWKKIPQATDPHSHRTSAKTSVTATTGFSSQHSTVCTARGAGNLSASSLRTSSSNGATQNCSPSPGTAYGPSESTGGSQPLTSPLPTNSPSLSSPGRPRNPVGRTGKLPVHLGQVEHGAASRKRRLSPHEDDSSSHDRNSVPQEKGRLSVLGRTAPSAYGPINGALSPGHKPRPQAETCLPSPGLFKCAPPSPDPSSRGRGGGSGVHSKAVSYDHKGLGRKCKGSGPSPPKIHRLPASSHSAFFSWKKDGTGGGLPSGLEKKLSTQKPKLHH